MPTLIKLQELLFSIFRFRSLKGGQKAARGAQVSLISAVAFPQAVCSVKCSCVIDLSATIRERMNGCHCKRQADSEVLTSP